MTIMTRLPFFIAINYEGDLSLEIDKYMPLVKKIAGRMVNHLPSRGDQYDDLVQAGLLGLVQAFRRF